MQRILPITLIFLMPLMANGLECTLPNAPQTRSFPSFANYQGNKISFDPLEATSKGNFIEFSFLTLNRIPKNSFITFTSQYIFKVSLDGKQIQEIDEGAFYSLQCLHILNLSNNNLSQLTRDIFSDLDHLQQLDLSKNRLETIEDLSFSLLKRLKQLDLSGNRIQKLEILAFSNLTSLEELNLSSNHLSKLNPNVFIPLTKLIVLNLHSNRINDLEPEKWTDLKTLEKLDVSSNYLIRFDGSYNFTFSNLKYLNLSSNRLTQLNVIGIRRDLPKLSVIDLNDNLWLCEDIIQILHILKDSRISCPGRSNDRIMNENGIACSNQSEPFRPSTTTTASEISPTTIRPETTTMENLSKEYLEKILISNRRILDSNSIILRTIHFVQVLIVCSLACIVFIMGYVIFSKWDVCRTIYRRFEGSSDYLDNDQVEDFRLIHR